MFLDMKNAIITPHLGEWLEYLDIMYEHVREGSAGTRVFHL